MESAPRIRAIVFKGKGKLPDGTIDPDYVIVVHGKQPVYFSSFSRHVEPGEPHVRVPGAPYAFLGASEERTVMGPLGWLIKPSEGSQTPLASFPPNYVLTIERTVSTPQEVNAWLRAQGAKAYSSPFDVGSDPNR